MFTFETNNYLKYVVEKGSITINGVSLTCFDVKDNLFSVAIIPHTYSKTNFRNILKNQKVNIEYDILLLSTSKNLPLCKNPPGSDASAIAVTM